MPPAGGYRQITRRRVEQNGRVPVFESAGPDRSFGDADDARQADNICSDEPLEAW